MQSLLLTLYPWIKALHIIAVISWMAGLLYLPRLFVYHCDETPGSATYAKFMMMEEKLSRVIMRPAMLATLVFGLSMISIPGTPAYLPHAGYWLWLKLTLAGGMLFAHYRMQQWRLDFANETNQHPQRFFRIMNEVPTVLMILIVILVVVKPF